MISEKNLKDLKLSEEQLQIYRDLEKREKAFRNILRKNKVHPTATEAIINNSDMKKVDLNNLEALEESIRQEWSDFIMKGEK